jgi:DNA-binding CsgD family transcriptional regulator
MKDALETLLLDRPPSCQECKTQVGPERGKRAPLQSWMAAMLDEVDYGLLLVGMDAQVLHANKAALGELDNGGLMQIRDHVLHACSAVDEASLRMALDIAGRRGLRRLIHMGEGSERASVSVVPLPIPEGTHDLLRPVLLVFGKRQMCEELSADGFSRAHGLTMAETQVLKRLCAGDTPKEIANKQGLQLSTVRSQLSSIRVKTSAHSIRDLVRQVAMLPPVVTSLRGAAPAKTDSQP